MKHLEIWLRRKKAIFRVLAIGVIAVALMLEISYLVFYFYQEELHLHYEMCDKYPNEISKGKRELL